MPDDVLRLAVLIDADNASASVIGDILAEVSKLGTASVKRVYGDFTTSSLQGWKAVLAEHAIQPVQQFRNTTGKNATDSALIIDAMDLLAGQGVGLVREIKPASQIVHELVEEARQIIAKRLLGLVQPA